MGGGAFGSIAFGQYTPFLAAVVVGPGDEVTTENAYFRREVTGADATFAREVTGSDADFRRTVTTADAER